MQAPQFVARAAEVALRAVTGFSKDRCGIAAAGITYYALLSMFPIALVGLSVAGYVFSSEEDQARLLDNIIDAIPIDEGGGREDLEGVIESVVSARGTLGIFGLLGALYAGSALFTSLRVALNGVFHTDGPRPFIKGKILDIGMLLVFGAMLLTSTAFSFGLAFLGTLIEEWVGDEAAGATRTLLAVVFLVIPPLISTGFFLLLYTKVPAESVRWRYALAGAIVAGVLYEILKAGFGFYAANFGNYDATYGSLGFVVLLLAFIYFGAQVTLLGAEVARATSEVQQGWPLSAEDSKVAGVRRKVASFWRKAMGWIGRKDEQPAGALPPVVHASGMEPETVLPLVDEPRAPRPSEGRAGSAAPWWGAAGFISGIVVGSFARRGRS